MITELHVASNKRRQIIDITDLIQEKLTQLNMQQGLCHVYITHTTAAMTTADLDPGTDEDMLDAFSEMIPKLHFRHPHDPEHVPDHIMASLIGPDVTVPVNDGRLVLGSWQRVVLVDLNGPRERHVSITIIKV